MRRSEWMLEKSEVVSRDGIVCAHHLAAAEAGAAMLERGGNAVDAAVAAAFAIGVAEPFNSGVGGIAQLLYRDASTGKVTVFDGTSVLPRKIRPELFPLAEPRAVSGMYGWPAVQDDRNTTGWLAPAVPGMPACTLAALERFGRLGRREVLAPAIDLAANGVTVDWNMALTILSSAERIARFPSSRAIFFRSSGFPLATASFSGPADTLVQTDLARTIGAIAEEGAAAFYRGRVARQIGEQMAENGGLIDEKELEAYRVRVFDDGVRVAYRDCEVVVAPETGGGLTVVQALRMLDGIALQSLGFATTRSLHQVIETQRRVFADRFRFLGDPKQTAVPYAGLFNADYAATRRSTIDPTQATPQIGPGDPWRFQGETDQMPDPVSVAPPDIGHTTHISVVDRDRNLVSLTSTLGDVFGSALIVPGTGVLLNCGTTWFDPRPSTHNSIAPGRRILWAGSPSLVIRQGRPLAAIGAPGGRKVISSVLQVILNLVDFQLGIQEAVGAPRVHCEGPDTWADSRLEPHALDALRELGHDLVVQTETVATSYFGRPNGVVVDEVAGVVRGGVSPFKPYYAVGL
jgi:gamma-glutamyltranspeptidase / glutathione hydrolase